MTPLQLPLDMRRVAVELEENLSTQFPDVIEDPLIFVLLLDRHHQRMRVVHIPYSKQQFLNVTEGYRGTRGRTGLFMTSIALAIRELTDEKLEENFGGGNVYDPGCELLFTALLSESLATDKEPGPEIHSFEMLPPEEVTDSRSLVACDGRGTAWRITRDLPGTSDPVVVEASCVPNPDEPMKFFTPPEDRDNNVTGGVAWALAVLAQTLRERLEDPVGGYPAGARNPHNGDGSR